MTDPAASTVSARAMLGLLTAPYRRGAETLAVPLGADAAVNGEARTAVPGYGFDDYRARHGSLPPEPKYVLYATAGTGPDGVEVEVRWTDLGTPGSARVALPPRTPPGTSFALPVPATATLRLTQLVQRPVPLPGTGAANFAVLALLGNLAKLAWVVGWGKDQARRALVEAAAQRRRANASGAGLDALGRDLRVPRFPPRPHSFDAKVLSLYHLDRAETVRVGGADVPGVADEVARFGRPAHPGAFEGTPAATDGKFAGGFRFADPGQAIVVPVADGAFDLPADRSFTAEAFVLADPVAGDAPRVVLMKGTVDAAGTLTGPGWALTVGTFRGVPHNARWAVGDPAVEVFADEPLADGRFHHLAGVIDRAGRRVRLFVDGVERGSAAVTLGDVTNAAAVRLGNSSANAHPFAGVIDEVRLSAVARADFHPVLGEGDDAYRRRLGLFERWLLPTPDQILEAVNRAVRIDGQSESFVLVETPRPGATGVREVRIVPAAVPSGQSLDRDGDVRSSEAEACGTAAEDTDFRPEFLHTHDRAQVSYGTDPNHKLGQAALHRPLDALVGLLPTTAAGQLVVGRMFDPAGPGLFAVGRAVRLRHLTLTPDALAVLAHRAGFDFVRNDGDAIYASVRAGDLLTIAAVPPAAPPTGVDVVAGGAIDLSVLPAGLPAGGEYRWSVVPSGPAVVRFATHPADAALTTPVTARPRLRLLADAPGAAAVVVEYAAGRRRAVRGMLALRIGTGDLADGATIAADGDQTIAEADAVGDPEPAVSAVYLVTSNEPGVDYGPAANDQMTVPLERAFRGLLAAQVGLATGLRVRRAFDPAGPGLHPAGRAVRLAHATVAPGRLAALAHHAGFGFVKREGTEVYAAVAAGELAEVVRADGTPLPDDLPAGAPVEVAIRPAPAAGTFDWSLAAVGRGDGTFDRPAAAATRFTPTRPGRVALVAASFEPDPARMLPYSFEVRLAPALDRPETVIPKPEYDLVMNVLSHFRPIGVEVVTANLRAHVREIEQDPMKAFPAYSFPDFRA